MSFQIFLGPPVQPLTNSWTDQDTVHNIAQADGQTPQIVKRRHEVQQHCMTSCSHDLLLQHMQAAESRFGRMKFAKPSNPGQTLFAWDQTCTSTLKTPGHWGMRTFTSQFMIELMHILHKFAQLEDITAAVAQAASAHIGSHPDA